VEVIFRFAKTASARCRLTLAYPSQEIGRQRAVSPHTIGARRAHRE
jgi:hypothetical protein